MDKLSPTDGLNKLRSYVTRWQLDADGVPFQTHSSWLQPVRHRGKPAMLKISMAAEERRGGLSMIWWEGEGVVRVLAHATDALLLERVCGGESLIDMARGGRDDDASRVLCNVAARLHAPRTRTVPELMPLCRWFESLTLGANAHDGVLREAAGVAEELLARPQDITVLHGDLHHGNVLDGGTRGWLAIDPKGLLGERGFDFANIFCNPDFDIATTPGRLVRQVAIIGEAAHLDRHRLLAWIASWAALSARWHLEDGTNPDTALAVARIALGELRGTAAP